MTEPLQSNNSSRRTWLWIGGCSGCGCLLAILGVLVFLLAAGRAVRDAVEEGTTTTTSSDAAAVEEILGDSDIAVLDDGSIVTTERVAGGESAQYRAQAGGVLPAENEYARVEEAGMGLQPGNAGEHGFYWQFTVTVRQGELQEIVVADVTVPAGVDPITVVPQTLVEDEAPVVNAGRWTGTTPAWIVSPDSFPWLYSDDKTAHWFRFTLRFADGTVTRLYQRTEYGPEVKATVVEQLRQWDA